jgi:hypothetical protein
MEARASDPNCLILFITFDPFRYALTFAKLASREVAVPRADLCSFASDHHGT